MILQQSADAAIMAPLKEIRPQIKASLVMRIDDANQNSVTTQSDDCFYRR